MWLFVKRANVHLHCSRLHYFLPVPGAPAVPAGRAREGEEEPEGLVAQGAEEDARRGGQAEEGSHRLYSEASGEEENSLFSWCHVHPGAY